MAISNDTNTDEYDGFEDVEARFALIASRIEQPLTVAQAAQVKSRIARSIALGVALRSYPLTNADEPEINLIPYRGSTQ